MANNIFGILPMIYPEYQELDTKLEIRLRGYIF